MSASADISVSSFLLDSFSTGEIFANLSAGNSFLVFNRFWNVRFSDRCNLILVVFRSVFDKS